MVGDDEDSGFILVQGDVVGDLEGVDDAALVGAGRSVCLLQLHPPCEAGIGILQGEQLRRDLLVVVVPRIGRAENHAGAAVVLRRQVPGHEHCQQKKEAPRSHG